MGRKRAALPRMRDFVKHKVAHQIVLEVLRRNEAGANKYNRKAKAYGENEEEDVEDGDGGSVGPSMRSSMTPFMSAKSKRTRKMLLTPCGDGQFGRHVPSNMLTPVVDKEEEGGKGGKDKNFLV